jgi:hypothetical protein
MSLSVGGLLEKLEMREQAVEKYKDVLRMDPSNREAEKRLDRLMSASG